MDRAVLETSSDRYVIVEYLAEGGMGAIYLGKKLGVGGFEKEVVLKQLLPEFTREPKFIDLFLREARLSASLEHANIVHTIDLVNAGDDYFMVMEYVKGADLRTLLKRVRRRHKRFSAQAGVFIGHEILEALAYAHAKAASDGRPLNLIHRDISPSNILLSGAGEVKLTDFGIAKASTHRSVFHKVKGKVGYMSPEQARSEPVDARSDLFSLGVVLYEVIVGERLFVGDLMSSASQIYAQPIKPPSQKRPEIPADLDTVILKALSLDPAGRFQSAEEFQEALTRIASRHRLIIGASEMAAHLRQVAGEDPSMWLKLEVIGLERSEPTQAHGTAVLSTGVDDDDSGRKSQFDLSDEDDDDDDDDSDVGELVRARNRPPSLPTGELTSIIAIRRKNDESEMLTKVQEGGESASSRRAGGESGPRRVRSGGDEQPLQPGRRSEPIPAAGVSVAVASSPSSRRQLNAPERSYVSDESRAQTVVRESPVRAAAPPVLEETRVRPPSSSSAAYGRLLDAGAAAPGPPGSAPPSVSSSNLPPGAARRLPASGIRPRPGGRAFDSSTYHVRRRPRRLIGIMIVLLLIGIGVALGVAFSGPELEVVDPTVLPTPPAPVPTTVPPPPASGAATRHAPPPSELPGPPPATPGTP